MDEKKKFTVLDEKGRPVVCEPLFTFESEETKKQYVVYTDNKDAGTATITINGIDYPTLTDADGNNFTVSYPGDDNYAPFNITGDITKDGSKINATLVVSAEDSVVGETTNITVTLPEDATGEVEVFVNDVSIGNKALVDGRAVFTTDK